MQKLQLSPMAETEVGSVIEWEKWVQANSALIPAPTLPNEPTARGFSTYGSPTMTSAIFNNRPFSPSPQRYYSTTLDPSVTPGQPSLIESSSATLDTAASASPELGQAVMHIGDLKAMGLVHYTPVGALQAALEAVYVSTGLPWWATIVVTTLLIRAAMTPLMIINARYNARLVNIAPVFTKLTEEMNEAKLTGNKLLSTQKSREIGSLYTKHGLNPLTPLILPAIQAPLMISFFIALRKMANLPVPAMATGGLGWFTDLTIPDPTYILPILGSVGFLAIIETGSESAAALQSQKMKYMFRGFSILVFYATMNFPSAVVIYFLTNNAFSICQAFALKTPFVRERFNIPPRSPAAQRFSEEKQKLAKEERRKGVQELGYFGYYKKMLDTWSEKRMEQQNNNDRTQKRNEKLALVQSRDRRMREDERRSRAEERRSKKR